ncbi:MAG: hypothetical protein AAAB35_14890 [Phyllobacterium sp.]|uniref:hypothetical protein n=1 Tax=Phyllobacterium sp. TaxID=1871046 RepID=UPI0030F24349
MIEFIRNMFRVAMNGEGRIKFASKLSAHGRVELRKGIEHNADGSDSYYIEVIDSQLETVASEYFDNEHIWEVAYYHACNTISDMDFVLKLLRAANRRLEGIQNASH